jgi:hypothetical protein
MDLGHGYDQTYAVREYLIPRRPINEERMQARPGWSRPAVDPFDNEESQAPPRSWNPTPSSMEAIASITEPTFSGQPSHQTLNRPQSQGRRLRRQTIFDGTEQRGFAIQSAIQRHFFSWVMYFFAICFFVFTVIFAWNATGGAKTNRHFIFTNPGRTILVLQICSTVTTSLFAECLISSFEMVTVSIYLSNKCSFVGLWLPEKQNSQLLLGYLAPRQFTVRHT